MREAASVIPDLPESRTDWYKVAMSSRSRAASAFNADKSPEIDLPGMFRITKAPILRKRPESQVLARGRGRMGGLKTLVRAQLLISMICLSLSQKLS
jgi:hypothetical protein